MRLWPRMNICSENPNVLSGSYFRGPKPKLPRLICKVLIAFQNAKLLLKLATFESRISLRFSTDLMDQFNHFPLNEKKNNEHTKVKET